MKPWMEVPDYEVTDSAQAFTWADLLAMVFISDPVIAAPRCPSASCIPGGRYVVGPTLRARGINSLPRLEFGELELLSSSRAGTAKFRFHKRWMLHTSAVNCPLRHLPPRCFEGSALPLLADSSAVMFRSATRNSPNFSLSEMAAVYGQRAYAPSLPLDAHHSSQNRSGRRFWAHLGSTTVTQRARSHPSVYFGVLR